ncbi:PRC-barrel domain-containing protein [Denitromonas iodatirespirans]|uniref:PRC-barrel domain-containing protein n=1 Tax=Denitromonas iodatirespirans TaxID=2795389 RepID=A0A944DH88_DENI1|nr:PRC-barrel domain-containing protein [Denitromonas iodatirespirans]MBT0962823.1 PRC-barrel domain-containing protein [Denitromonas iodatirespirans]
MNARFKNTLIAASIAAFAASPVWAETEGKVAPGKAAQESTAPAGKPRMQQDPASSASRSDQMLRQGDLAGLTPDQLEGKEVFGPDGKHIGEIESVVSDAAKQGVKVVISMGGLLGIGDKEAAVPFDQLKVVNGKLTVSQTKEALTAASEGYKEENYVALEPKDQPISEFSAFEPVPGAGQDRGAQPNAGTAPRDDVTPGAAGSPTAPAEIMPKPTTPEQPQ